MSANDSVANDTSNFCNIDWRMFQNYHLYTSITCSILSFIGNIIVILTVYLNKTLHSTPNYIIVNMAVSDMFVPTTELLATSVLDQKDAGILSQTAGAALCKFEYLLINFSFGVSMLSLVVITVHRFYAVAYPMKARLERIKTCVILLACTWLAPLVVFCPMLHFLTFDVSLHSCVSTMSEQQHIIHSIVNETLFTGIPLLIMLILYPVIIIKLRRQKVPGNTVSSLIIRRRKQNILLTKMFITIFVAFVSTWLTSDIVHFIYEYSHKPKSTVCGLFKIWAAVAPFPLVFHAINPVLYFIFCSSYREGFKTIFLCFSRRNGRNVPLEGEQLALETVSQRGRAGLSFRSLV